jgi:CRP/FNR family transcriptional regulator, cyclic AMP receptor protein
MQAEPGMRADVFARNGWLSAQPAEFRGKVLAACEPRPFAAGTSIYSQGDPAGGIYGIERGMVALSVRGPAAEASMAQLLRPGEWFGGSCFLTREPRRLAARAWTDSLLLHLPLEAMDRLAEEDAENLRRFGRLAMEGLDMAHRALSDLMLPSPAQRVAAALTRAVEGAGRTTLALTQQDLGAMANASRKLVNQSLSRFAGRRWVRVGYRQIEVIDVEALRRFVGDPDAASAPRVPG